MQNLSLPISSSANIKLAEEANKNSANQNQANVESNNAFQTMLNQQVQAKRNIENQRNIENKNVVKSSVNKPMSSKPVTNQVASQLKSNTSSPNASTNTSSQVKSNTEARENANNSAEKNQSDVVNAQSSIAEKAKDIKAVSASEDVEKNIVSGSELNPMTADATILAALMSGLVTNTTQPAADSASQVTGSLSEEAKAAAGDDALTKSLDAVLSQALTKDQTVADSIQNSTINNAALADAKQTNWLNAMQGRGNQSAADDKNQQNIASDSHQEGHTQTQALSDMASKELLAKTNARLENSSFGNAVSENADIANSIKELNMANSMQSAKQSNTLVSASDVGSANQINAYPGKAGWDQAISQKVVWMVGAGEQSATLTLNPPDLGPLQVVIQVHNDQADTTFISDNPEVRQALQDGMDNLREKMEASGIQLGQANVNAGGQSQQSFQEATSNNKATFESRKQDLNTTATDSPRSVLVRESNGLVDTFA